MSDSWKFQRASHQIAELTSTVWTLRAEASTKDYTISQLNNEIQSLRTANEQMRLQLMDVEAELASGKKQTGTAPTTPSPVQKKISRPRSKVAPFAKKKPAESLHKTAVYARVKVFSEEVKALAVKLELDKLPIPVNVECGKGEKARIVYNDAAKERDVKMEEKRKKELQKLEKRSANQASAANPVDKGDKPAKRKEATTPQKAVASKKRTADAL